MSALTTADVLVEALPYIRRFAGRTVVVKYGGNALAGTSDHDALTLFAEDIVLMHTVGIRPVVVHGGGPQINEMLARLNIESSFSNGLRVTDASTMQVVQMVLNGHVNPQIVSAINTHGNVAVGLSGEDGRTLQVTPRDPALGFVGDIEKVRPQVIEGLLADGFVPVLSTVGVDANGQPYNINADTAAGAIAEALGAEKIIYLTDIAGLRAEIDNPDSLIKRITVNELSGLIADGTVSGGMIPKVESCMQAVRGGVKSAHILDGRIAHVLLLELFTDQGVGTMITGGTS
ncbi:MAG: acetylglutamate kinase [Actinomycetota bacterium]|jgi:acetylglutamate kinase